MADPLSITASVLTIITAAAETGKAVARMKNVTKLPGEFSSLFAEVADLNHVLQECYTLEKVRSGRDAADRGANSGCATPTALETHARRASAKLTELEQLLRSRAAPIGASTPAELRAFWSGLVHGKSRLSRARDELRDIRLGLAATLQLSVTTRVSSIDSTVQSIKTNQQQIASHQHELRLFVHALAEHARSAALQAATPDIKDEAKEDVAEVRRTTSAPDPVPKAMTVKKPELGARRRTIAGPGVPVVQDQYRNSCRAWCSCRCHTPSSLRSYGPIKNVFGSLSVTHSGLPYLTYACDQKTCRRRSSPRINVSYKFPAYFAERLFTASIAASNLAGPEVRVKLPRVVGWDSPLWQYAIQGDTKAVQNLFRSGQASPWDVQSLNGNLLHYVTDHWNADLCKLLLDAGVDTNAEDDFRNTPVGIAWERVLSGQMSPEDSSIAADLFGDADYLSERRFSPVHKIVLGLSHKDLDLELECSTADIDVQDSRGRTPVSWAAARGNEESLRILIAHGADVTITDCVGETPLHQVRNTACAQLLIGAGASVLALNDDGKIPLHCACQITRSASLVDFLLMHKSDVNAVAMGQLETPLHLGTVKPPALPFVDVLLDWGADVNARNNSRDTPVRFAVSNNQHTLLRRMLEPQFQANFSGFNNYGQSFWHTLARHADVRTLDILASARPISLKPEIDTLDTSKKTAVDYLEERVLCQNEDESLRLAFYALVDALEGKSVLDDMTAMTEKLETTLSIVEVVPSPITEEPPELEHFHEAAEILA